MTPIAQTIVDLLQASINYKFPWSQRLFLKERDALILNTCYNFESNSFPSFKEIKKDFEITDERIRQLHNRSFRKLEGIGRNKKNINPCSQLNSFLIENIAKTQGENKYIKLINFGLEHFAEMPDSVIVQLFSRLVYKDRKDIGTNILMFKQWKSNKPHRLNPKLKVTLAEKAQFDSINSQTKFLDLIIWFASKASFSHIHSADLFPARLIVKDYKYKSGIFFSEKCNRNIQHESGLELEFIKKLEGFPEVKFYLDQPLTIEYISGGKKFPYTPDFAIYFRNGNCCLVEVKPLNKMVDGFVYRKLEALIPFCKSNGFGLLLTDGSDSIIKLLSYTIHFDFERELKFKLESNGNMPLLYPEIKILKNKYKIKWREFLAIVLMNNWNIFYKPLRIIKSNNFKMFTDTLISIPLEISINNNTVN